MNKIDRGGADCERVLESAFECYRPVTGTIPTRPRCDHDPLNREDYLRQVPGKR